MRNSTIQFHLLDKFKKLERVGRVVSEAVGGAAAGVSTFLGLTDTPASYAGQALKVTRVNAGETALEFAVAAGGGDVVGPAVAVDSDFCGFDGVTGKLIKDGGSKAADFAVAAKGVTGGDSHDHVGGDGAQIDHGGLGGLADDDHTIYTKKATLTEQGDIYYASAASTPAALAHGTSGQVLTTGGHGANPYWGAAGGAADGLFFQYRRAGQYYGSQARNFGYSSVFITLSANYLYAWPFIVGSDQSFDRITIQVYTAAAGNVRMGIYADDGSVYPGALTLDAGTVAVSTSGIKEITIASTLSPGLYWLVLVGNVSPILRAILISDTIPILGGPSDVYDYQKNSYYVSFTYAVLPNPFPVSAVMGQENEPILLRRA